MFEYEGQKYTYEDLVRSAKKFGYDTDAYIASLTKQGMKQIKT